MLGHFGSRSGCCRGLAGCARGWSDGVRVTLDRDQPLLDGVRVTLGGDRAFPDGVRGVSGRDQVCPGNLVQAFYRTPGVRVFYLLLFLFKSN